jgi:ATP-binding cassette subfamily C protein CydCD
VGAAILFVSRRVVDRAQTRAWRAWERVAEQVADACDGRLELVAAGRAPSFLASATTDTARWGSEAARAGRVAGLLGRLPVLLLATSVGAAAVSYAHPAGTSLVDAALRAGFLAFVAPAFLGVANGLQEAVTNHPRLLLASRILHASGPLGLETGTAPLPPLKVEWSDVTFGYHAAGPVALKSISMTWAAGELIVLAGSNGSGKSSCLRACLGLGHRRHGQLMISGVPVEALRLDAWRERVAFLPQNPYLPPRATLRDCMRFLDPELSDETLRYQLERLGLPGPDRHAGSDDILETKIGELSAGQRQRVALARTLSRDVPVYLLDEPDANLDRETLGVVADVLAALSRDHLVVITAHTREVIERADRLITLTEGTVASNVSRLDT